MKTLVLRKSKVKENYGFTLLEIMIVLALLAVIAVIAFPNFRSMRVDQSLQAEAMKIKSDIRYMQQIAFDTQNRWTMSYGTSSYNIRQDSALHDLKAENLENNVKFESSGAISIGGDGIPSGATFPVTITLIKNGLKTEVKIYSGGKIEIL